MIGDNQPEPERRAPITLDALDVIALMDALIIDRAIVAGCDWGARTAAIVAALWPERCKALVSDPGVRAFAFTFGP